MTEKSWPTHLRAVKVRVIVKSLVRENCTPGSVRGTSGNRRLYLDLTTLRYAHEVRPAASLFEDLPESPVGKEEVSLAQRLVENQSAPLNLAQFTDRYQDALLKLVQAKVHGTVPIVAPQVEVGKVIQLMEALKQSVAQSTRTKGTARRIRKQPKAA